MAANPPCPEKLSVDAPWWWWDKEWKCWKCTICKKYDNDGAHVQSGAHQEMLRKRKWANRYPEIDPYAEVVTERSGRTEDLPAQEGGARGSGDA